MKIAFKGEGEIKMFSNKRWRELVGSTRNFKGSCRLKENHARYKLGFIQRNEACWKW